MRTLLLLLLLLLAGSAAAQVGISPAYYDLSQEDAGKTQTFRIFNYTTEPKKVRVSLVPWKADGNNQPQLLEPGPTTLDQWVVVNPVEFEVKAKSSQAVRFSVRPATPMSTGEHRVMFIFDEIVTAEENANMRARFQFRSALYVQVGEATRRGEIVSVDADANGVRLKVKNVGSANVRFDGQVSIWEAARFPGVAKTELVPGLASMKTPPLAPGELHLDTIPASPILPGDTHVIQAGFGALKLKPGRYVADLNGKLGESPLDRSVEFVVTETPK
ncbi:hypothetical protein [Tahibacter amnicola]|uniref:P pilus assembly chaperone PapD n=1 Tax=Tahibacter amnicola TaxID=2976241 RepID=A0ABY6BGA7_9GAMM|nr:hypothetical protein [Tahibacter amnicola]UXI67405.1 hypothetical protein N4264_22135 [Tahibacter amnicola]